MSITITGEKSSGEHFSKVISKDEKIVDFSLHFITSINLSSLQYCKKLEALNLGTNHLSYINLSALQRSVNLKILNLDSNKLSSIALTPLKNCYNLKVLSRFNFSYTFFLI